MHLTCIFPVFFGVSRPEIAFRQGQVCNNAEKFAHKVHNKLLVAKRGFRTFLCASIRYGSGSSALGIPRFPTEEQPTDTPT